MRRPLLQRQVMLAGAALLAIVASLAITSKRGSSSAPLPEPSGSYTALFSSTGSRSFGTTTSCGVQIGAATLGISSPVLPCGVGLYLTYGGRTVLATVIGRTPSAPGGEFGLTQALAQRLGVIGVRRLRWSYAATS
jgi:hypothetical protein